MSNAELDRYLTQVYRRDILGESVEVGMPVPDPQLLADIKAELARINALRLGANLASRDFVSYQNRQALEKLLAQLEAQGTSDASD
jgi:hypothetical protein